MYCLLLVLTNYKLLATAHQVPLISGRTAFGYQVPVQLAAARSAKGQLARYLTVAATHYEVPSIGGTESVRLPPLALILNSNPNPPTPTKRV